MSTGGSEQLAVHAAHDDVPARPANQAIVDTAEVLFAGQPVEEQALGATHIEKLAQRDPIALALCEAVARFKALLGMQKRAVRVPVSRAAERGLNTQ